MHIILEPLHGRLMPLYDHLAAMYLLLIAVRHLLVPQLCLQTFLFLQIKLPLQIHQLSLVLLLDSIGYFPVL